MPNIRRGHEYFQPDYQQDFQIQEQTPERSYGSHAVSGGVDGQTVNECQLFR